MATKPRRKPAAILTPPAPPVYGDPCPECKGPRLAVDAGRLCEACRSPDGRMAELALAVQLVGRGVRPRETLHRLPCWAGISTLACQRFGHPMFTGDTLECLESFVQETAGLGDDREAMLRVALPEVVKLLRTPSPADTEAGPWSGQLSLKKLAAIFDVNERTIRRWIKYKDLPHNKVGRFYQVPLSALPKAGS